MVPTAMPFSRTGALSAIPAESSIYVRSLEIAPKTGCVLAGKQEDQHADDDHRDGGQHSHP